jgi:molecular chaperone GrpE
MTRRVRIESAADRADGTARNVPTAESPGHAKSLPSAEEEQQPSTPAGEPEAPTGPTRPHGDELEEALPEKGPAEPPAEQPETEDHESRVQRDLEELAAKAEKADEYLELAQRTKADFENYRKRAARESAAAQERGVAKLARELLPAVDNLDRALAAAEADRNGGELLSGIKLVHADVIAALARVGIEPFSPEGERFDPTCHEAVAQLPSESAQPGTVVEVYQRGYRLGESVLRPARVVVAS